MKAEAFWHMPATVVRWRDGDSVIVDAMTMPGNTQRAVIRLYGIDTPEEGEPGHDEAATCAEGLAHIGSVVELLVREKTDKYGRWLAEVVTHDDINVNDFLLRNGHAVAYFGGTKATPAS